MGVRRLPGRSADLTRLYKILDRAAWEAARRDGDYHGSDIDRADGFIHFSTASQAAETARRHFQGQNDLLVLAVEAETLGEALRWEPSRGGALFPHLYAPLPCHLVVETRSAPLGDDGVPVLGALAP